MSTDFESKAREIARVALYACTGYSWRGSESANEDVDRIAAAIIEARRAQNRESLERCIPLACVYCADSGDYGLPAEFREGEWRHYDRRGEDYGYYVCRAGRIRALASEPDAGTEGVMPNVGVDSGGASVTEGGGGEPVLIGAREAEASTAAPAHVMLFEQWERATPHAPAKMTRRWYVDRNGYDVDLPTTDEERPPSTAGSAGQEDRALLMHAYDWIRYGSAAGGTLSREEVLQKIADRVSPLGKVTPEDLEWAAAALRGEDGV